MATVASRTECQMCIFTKCDKDNAARLKFGIPDLSPQSQPTWAVLEAIKDGLSMILRSKIPNEHNQYTKLV